MKRDVDLIRQLLSDIERHGAECSLDMVRPAAAPEADERIRYHVRLMIDAGLVKETDRAAGSQPCIRLASAGHELLDLCRGDARWREAKRIVYEQTGGLSLSVLRAVLTQWAVEGISRRQRLRRWRRTYRPVYGRAFYHDEPWYREMPYRVESYRYEREPLLDGAPVHPLHPEGDYRDVAEPNGRWDHDARFDGELADEPLGVSLPVHMI